MNTLKNGVIDPALRGHEYIKARDLTPQSVREPQHACPTCKQREMLPAVMRILERFGRV